MPVIKKERVADMAACWNAEMADPDSRTWRDKLTAAERAIVDKWDGVYNADLHRICKSILTEGGLYG